MIEFWKEIGRQEGKIIQAKKTILNWVRLAKKGEPSEETRGIVDYISDLERFDAIIDDMIGVTDIREIEAIIKKRKLDKVGGTNE